MTAGGVRAGPFKYVGGEAALDFVNTVDWTDTGTEEERLHAYADLVEWALGAGLLTDRGARRVNRAATEQPRAANRALAAARRLRLALRRLFAAVADGDREPEAELEEFNRWLARALRSLEIATPESGFAWSWGRALDEPLGILWPVVWSAAHLLTSPDLERVAVCSGDRCGWLFVDRSRNRRRRWCQMEVCGNRAKVRRHYARHRRSTKGGD